MGEELLQWEREMLAQHRWGVQGEVVEKEHTRLRRLYDRAAPLDEDCKGLVEQIVALEICNWRLEESLLALCEAIGSKCPAPWAIGHKASVTPERWDRIWAYYLSLREWLAEGPRQCRAYPTLLAKCDADGEIQRHVREMLGEPDEVKRLRVERLCLHVEFWLDGLPGDNQPRKKALEAAAAAIDAEIEAHAENAEEFEHAERGFGHRMRLVDNGQLHPCHHKLFRRYDILISSIGCGKWRGAMPYRGTDGFQRAETLEEYLAPVTSWIDGASSPSKGGDAELAATIHDLLGRRDDVKAFLASLLVSLLRSQQLLARQQAEEAAQKAP
jgi:hypothetical protein